MKFLFILLFCLNVFSDPIEKFSKPRALVGELINYSLTNIKTSECKIPAKDFLMDKETPYAEILELNIGEDLVSLQIAFYKSGKFKVPIQCKNFQTSLEIEIETSLENEKEQIDIKSPISFSGNYWNRLILLILLAIGLTVLLGYFLKSKKLKRGRLDADSISVLDKEVEETYQSKLVSLLKNQEIPHKEFIFLLSSYIKERIELKLNYPIQHFTQKELNEILMEKFSVSNLEILTMESYFNSVKYMPNEESIPQLKAIALFDYWTRLIK